MIFNPDSPHEHAPGQREIIREKLLIARASLKPVETELRWQAGNRYHCVSACGYYTVSKGLTGGYPRYSAWYRLTGKAGCIPRHLGTFDALKEAKARATDHALSRIKP